MLRLTVLTDSVRAVRAASDTLSKLGLATSPLERVAHGCRAVAAADNVRVELREVSWLSELRRLRNAPRLGALVASGPDGSSPAPLALASSWLARHALLGETPAVLRDARLEASRTSKGLLREVVVSSSKLDAADAFFEVKRRVAQPKSTPPGVIRSGGVDWRVQPLSSSAAALVFRCSSVADTADQLRRAGVRFDHVGQNGTNAGQLVVDTPWRCGLEFRLCERTSPAAQFHESFRSITESEGHLPELQPTSLTGVREAGRATAESSGCWGETHAILRRPLQLFGASR